MAFDLILTNSDKQFDRLSLDIAFGPTGDFDIGNGQEKLVQDINKILLTILSNHFFHPEYGSLIRTFIGRKIANPETIKVSLAQTTANAIAFLNKELNSGTLINFPDEVISEVNSIQIVWLGEITEQFDDPSQANMQFDIKLNLTTGSGRPLSVAQRVSLPRILR